MVVVKVQQSGETNIYVNIPKTVREMLDIKKGDALTLDIVKGSMVLKKVKGSF